VNKGLTGEVVRFLFAGGVNTLVSYVVYLALLQFMPYIFAYSMCYFFGVVFSYWLQSKWVFQVDVTAKKFFVFPSVYVVQYALGVVLLAVLVEWFKVPDWISPLIVVAATLPVTFLMSRYLLKSR